MPSLVTQLGLEYVDQFYKGAYFMYAGNVYLYGRHITNEQIKCHMINKDTWSFTQVEIPSNVIDTMDFFAWPKLGYREYITRGIRNTSYITLQRSAMRGLKDDLLDFSCVGDTYLLPSVAQMRESVSQAVYANEIFNPKFTPFLEGLENLRDGKAISFALNEDIAVAFSCTQGPDRLGDVLYKQKVIGEVRPNGEVVIPHKIAKKASSSILFNGKLKL